MEVIGKIKVINAEQQVSASFKKRELVVATDEQYPQFISINFVQDKTEILDNYRLGDEVKVSINLRGRCWTNPEGEDKYFNDIQGWRIEKLAEGSGIEVNQPKFEPSTDFKEEENDLPF